VPPSFPSGQREREECKKRRIVPPLPLRLSLPSPVDRVREILGHQFGGPFEGDRLAGGDGLDGHVYGLGMRAVREQAQAGSPFFYYYYCALADPCSPPSFFSTFPFPPDAARPARVCARPPLYLILLTPPLDGVPSRCPPPVDGGPGASSSLLGKGAWHARLGGARPGPRPGTQET